MRSDPDTVIVEHVVKDGLHTGWRLDDYQPTNTWWYRVPSSWVSDGDFTDEARELVFANLYGKTWRHGNADGSRYVIIEETARVLTAAERAERPWEEESSGCYHVESSDQFTHVEADDFAPPLQGP